MRRSLIVMLALLGCVANAMLVPWHGALMAARGDVMAELAAGAICHGAGDAATDQQPGQLPKPPQPDKQCPICKAVAGAQLAVLVTAQLGLLAPPVAVFDVPRHVTGETVATITPRSRGPPQLA